MVGQANTLRARQAFSVLNSGQDLSNGGGDSLRNGASDCGSAVGSIEFSREEVEALLNEKKTKGKNKFDYKGKCEQMTDYIRKLKLCVKWFQELEISYQREQEKLQNMLESSQRREAELEAQMKNKVEELNALIAQLRGQNTTLEEKLSKEMADKSAAMESFKRESEARVAVEKSQISLSEELEKALQEAQKANQHMSSLLDNHKRLQEYNTSLQQYNSKLQMDASTANETITRLNKEKNAMMETLSSLRAHTALLQEQLTSTRTSQQDAVRQKEALTNEVVCLRAELQQVRDDRDLQIVQVQALKVERERYYELTGKSTAELENLTTKTNLLEETCSSQLEQLRTLRHQLDAANDKLKLADLSVWEKRAECQDQEKIIEDLENRLAESELRLREGEELRKRLHNTILELKGNIRVFCRVRPLLPDDDCGSTETSVSYPSSTELLGRGIELTYNGQKYPFSFDKVFSHDASQQEVFVEISQLVQSALDGYKVCVFAYGQTGSGKTYTMMGKPDISEQRGLMPRSLEQMFQTSQTKTSQGWTYKMQASMLEIYNETIRDLLSMNRSSGGPGYNGKQHAIKLDTSGNTYVSDLTIVDVCSIQEVTSLLRKAAQSRSVGKTQMNEESSRSHFVFTLRVTGINKSTEEQVQGVLNLIDLAGSERVSKSGSVGDQLDEAKAINLSLTTLKKVISSLTKKATHIPYRESKLTYLLQPCLGGDSKTLMFLNISPVLSSAGESLDSLRFANMVNACEIGTARRQIQMRSSESRLSCGPQG
ncbi:kinesin-like protein KIN-14C isoform X2 [Aristolochia californica]